MTTPRFTISIPNFNYGRYLGEALRSVLDQEGVDLDVVVSDNASTDASVEVARRFEDPRLRVEVNPCNVGFAANLDRAVGPGQGDWVLLLSSDDVLTAGALARYAEVIATLGAAERVVIGASCSVIDAEGNRTGRQGPPPWAWTKEDLDPTLTAQLGSDTYRVAAPVLLRRCLASMRNPLIFAATTYPRSLHHAVGGYGGARLSNPDKWFVWRVLGVADEVVFVDDELAGYRVHGANQSDLQAAEGGLRHLVDEYATTLEVSDGLLDRAGMRREDVQRSFLRQDIALRGFAELLQGRRSAARRRVGFGIATYPQLARTDPALWTLRALCAVGPLGTFAARTVRNTPSMWGSAIVAKLLGSSAVGRIELEADGAG